MKEIIESGRAFLGIEFGSTRIKSVLIGPDFIPLASGSHEWENEYRDGVWTYSENAIREGFQASYADLKKNVEAACGVKLTKLAGIGVSAGNMRCVTRCASSISRRFPLFSEKQYAGRLCVS